MAKSSFEKHKTSDTVKWILTLLVILGLIASVVALFIKLDRQTSTTTIGGEAYSIGLIDDTGAYAEGNTAIYLRKAITTDGLKCELTEDGKIKYQIFFYDKDGKFLSATEELTSDYTGADIPEGATQAKIMITPLADEDGKVSVLEVLGYASYLKVTVNN